MQSYLSTGKRLSAGFFDRKQETAPFWYQSHDGPEDKKVKSLSLLRLDVLFYGHVSELARVKNIAAFLAFNELNVFFTGYNAHSCVPAEFLHSFNQGERLAIAGFRPLHSYSDQNAAAEAGGSRISGILSLLESLSSISRGFFRKYNVEKDEEILTQVAARVMAWDRYPLPARPL